MAIKDFAIVVMTVLIFAALGAVAFRKSTPKEPTYDQKEAIAMKWLAEHEDRWRYTLCNVQLKPMKAEPMDSNGGGK